ncbi:bifunctional ornithine acetyltransferase/N-acetylglutamate synthase [bacterium]|nr:bifunctional ornithine acetyltransferase/N-acetylglutamate synthase [bacterium]
MKEIESGITAPRGFKAAGISCGIKKRNKKDLALIYSEVPARAAALFTTNQIKAAPLKVSAKHIEDGEAQAIVINSGCANAATGKKGIEDAEEMARITAEELSIKKEDVLVASTGTIGTFLPMDKITEGIKEAKSKLSREGGSDTSQAIMTTDTFPKEVVVELEIGGKEIIIGGMAKGAGMISPHLAPYNSAKGEITRQAPNQSLRDATGQAPNQSLRDATGQATMLSFITTDAAISDELLKKALKSSIAKSFNMITVDGEESTNDMVVILANGLAGNEEINEENEDFRKFTSGLDEVTLKLAKMIVKDGEGATKFIEVEVKNALKWEDAKKIAFSIANSLLVKTAIFGEDANWGRIMAAIGNSGVKIEEEKIDIYLGDLKLASSGCGIKFSEKKAKRILKGKEIKIIVDLNLGKESAKVWTCDLSPEYVKINAHYRT